MDLHKDLNRLSAACAEETVNGAQAFGLLREDRPTVVESIRKLIAKGDYPEKLWA